MKRGKYNVKKIHLELENGETINVDVEPGEPAFYRLSGSSASFKGDDLVWETHEVHWTSNREVVVRGI